MILVLRTCLNGNLRLIFFFFRNENPDTPCSSFGRTFGELNILERCSLCTYSCLWQDMDSILGGSTSSLEIVLYVLELWENHQSSSPALSSGWRVLVSC